MGFFKTLFGGKETTTEELEENKQQYDYEVLTYDGAQALHIGKTDYAIACLERALTIREDEDTRLRLARAYVQNDDLEEAVEQYSELCRLHPDEPSYPIAQAELQYQLQQYDEMKSTLDSIIACQPQLAMPHYLLAKLSAATQDYDTALDECTLAIQTKEDYDEARLLRSQMLAKLNKLDEAQADIDLLIANDNRSDETLMQKAAICDLQGNTDEAEQWYRSVIEQNPFIPEAYTALAGLLTKAGRSDDASKVIADAVEQLGVSPEQADTLQKGEFQSVEEYMRGVYNALNPYQLNMDL